MRHDDQRAADDASSWLRELLADRRVWARQERTRDAEQTDHRCRPPGSDDEAGRSGRVDEG